MELTIMADTILYNSLDNGLVHKIKVLTLFFSKILVVSADWLTFGPRRQGREQPPVEN